MKKTGLKKDPLFCVIAAIEIIFILFLLLKAFRMPYSVILKSYAFSDNARNKENIEFSNDNTVFKTKEYIDGHELSAGDFASLPAESKARVISYKFPLRSGAYTVTASYRSKGGYYDDAAYDQYRTGSLTFRSEEKKSLLKSGVMIFDDSHKQVKGRIYIPFGSSISDVQAILSYEGIGSLEVSDILLEESVIYRFMQILGYLFFFIIIDLLYLALFSGLDIAGKLTGYLKEHKEIPVIAVIVLIAGLPFFAEFLYYGHDLKFHMARLSSLAEGLKDMRFPVRIASSMLNGYGYATPLFYCDIFLYPFALLYNCMLPLRTCFKLYAVTVNLLTAVFSYRCFKEMSGDRDIALGATAFYTLNIYRLVDVYARAALGEYTALMFIPLAAHGLFLICKKEKALFRDIMLLAVGMAGIAMSHLLSLELITITLIVYCLIFFRGKVKGKITALIKAGVIAVLLSLWFLLPLLSSMMTIKAQAFEHIIPIQYTGGYLVQLFALFVSGYGMSGTGTYESMAVGLGGGFIVIFVTAILLCSQRFSLKEDSEIKDRYRIMAGNFAVGLVAVIFSSVYFPWDALAGIFKGRIDAISDLMQAIQFPWRYLTVAGIALSAAFVFALLIIKKKDEKKYRAVLYLMICLTLVSVCSFYYEFTQKNNEESWIFADNDTNMGIAAEEYLVSEKGIEFILQHPFPECVSGDAKISSYNKYDSVKSAMKN